MKKSLLLLLFFVSAQCGIGKSLSHDQPPNDTTKSQSSCDSYAAFKKKQKEARQKQKAEPSKTPTK